MTTLKDAEQDSILTWLKGAIAESTPPQELLQQVSTAIHATLPEYNWVGFYMVDPADSSMLVLGPYSGAATRIRAFQ